MLTIAGIPAHPLVVHAVVVLLPLAAVGTLVVAARPVWRRQLGIWVLLLAFAGVAAVPVATQTGEQLQRALGSNPLIKIHEQHADTLLIPALIFLALLAATVFVGRRFDAAAPVDGPGAAHAATSTTTDTATLQRVTTVVGVLAALAGLVVVGLVIWIGHAGATAVWSGVTGTG
jgi:Predicted membrane protein (DUF2231)